MSTRREFMFTVTAMAAGMAVPRAAHALRFSPRNPRQFADLPLKATLLRENVWSTTRSLCKDEF